MMKTLIFGIAIFLTLQAGTAHALRASLIVTATVLGRCDIDLGPTAQNLDGQCATGSSINQIRNTTDERGYTVRLSTSGVDMLSIKADGGRVALGSLNISQTILPGSNASSATPPHTVRGNLILVSVEP